MKRLTVRERKFAKLIVEDNLHYGDAYVAVLPKGKTVTPESAAELGSRMWKRIQGKAEFREMLDAAGVSDEAIARKIKQLMEAKHDRYWQDKHLGTFEDNTTQARVTELAAELRGHRKQRVDLADVTELPQVVVTGPGGEDGDPDGAPEDDGDGEDDG